MKKNLLKLFSTLLITLIFTQSLLALSPSQAAVEKKYNAVTLIAVPGPDADGDMVDGLCNATLINATTIITAAHCFAKSPVLNGGTFKLEVGEYRYIEKEGQLIRIGYKAMQKFVLKAKIQFLPGVNPNGGQISPDSDIAIVTLTTTLPLAADFVYAKFWNQVLQLNQATQVKIVSINPIETINHNDTKQFAMLNSISAKGYQIISKSTSRVAQSDSGAPVFATISGEEYLIGVVKGRADTAFSNWDVIVTSQGRLK